MNGTRSSAISAWLLHGAAAMAVLGGLLVGIVSSYVTPPSQDHVAGVVFSPTAPAQAGLSAVISADSQVQVVETRLDGWLVFVRYSEPEFPRRVRELGAILVFDAVAAGCHNVS